MPTWQISPQTMLLRLLPQEFLVPLQLLEHDRVILLLIMQIIFMWQTETRITLLKSLLHEFLVPSEQPELSQPEL
jgi:hypothetical protein